jgi:hypothetical protein
MFRGKITVSEIQKAVISYRRFEEFRLGAVEKVT